MICSTTYRSILALTGAAIMTLGTFSILQASVDRNAAVAKSKVEAAQLEVRHSATISRWRVASERPVKPGV